MYNIPSWISYIIVGCLWGCTNPFLKKGQEAIDKAKNEELQQNENKIDKEVSIDLNHSIPTPLPIPIQNSYKQWRIYKLLDYHIYIPFCINQCGSLMFYILLSTEPLGVVVPIVNCLTFLFTVLTATYIGHEKIDSPILLWLGCIFVFMGMYLCANN